MTASNELPTAHKGIKTVLSTVPTDQKINTLHSADYSTTINNTIMAHTSDQHEIGWGHSNCPLFYILMASGTAVTAGQSQQS